MRKLKLLSLICTLAMLITCFAVFPAFADGPTEPAAWKTGDDTSNSLNVTYGLNQENFIEALASSQKLKCNFVLLEDIIFNDKAEDSLIKLTFKIDNREYTYSVSINFTTSKIIREILLLSNAPIFTRNDDRIIIEDKEYQINGELLLGLRQLYSVIEEIETYKSNIKEVYDYLVNITIVKGDSSVYNSSL